MRLFPCKLYHKIRETDNAVYLDRKRIDFVVKDSVKVENCNGKVSLVTLTIPVKEYRRINKRSRFGGRAKFVVKSRCGNSD